MLSLIITAAVYMVSERSVDTRCHHLIIPNLNFPEEVAACSIQSLKMSCRNDHRDG